MATIDRRQAKNGKISYRVRVRLKGCPVQTATFSRKTDARKWIQDVESSIREGRYFKTAEAKKHTFGEMIDRFKSNELPKLPKVKGFMGPQLDWWKDQLGAYTLADVTTAMIVEYRDKLLRDGTPKKKVITPATVNRYLAALSLTYTRAVNEWEWVESNPLRKVKKLPEPKGRVRFLSDDGELQDGTVIEGEKTRLLKACRASPNQYLYPVVVLALSTGMRKSEIMTLTWKDIDLNKGQIYLKETKNGERRSVPLVGHALDVIKNLGKVRRLDTNLLFPSKKNAKTKPIHLRDPWQKALKIAQIDDFRFHDLRHSAASYLAMNGATLVEIADILGHKTLSMVKRYSHLSEAHTASVVSSMNEKIFD